MDDQLRRAAIKGVGWAFFSSTGIRLIQITTTLVLAKLLVPADFGVFALASIVVNALMVFRDLGFAQVLIYRQGDIDRTARTAFTLSILASLTMAVALAASAPLLVTLLGSTRIVQPIRVMALGLLVSGAANVPLALLDRQLLFRLRALPEMGGAAANGAVAITLAALGFGAWSIVLGWTAMAFVVTGLALVISPIRPAFIFDRDEARGVIDYGKHLMAASLATFAFFNVDNLSVGKWLGERSLGLYSLAFTVCNLPATNLSHVISRVMFPTYSKLQDDLSGMGSVYLTTIRYISLAAFPAAVAIMVIAGPVIRAFYGSKWIPAIPIFHVLAVYGLMRSIGSTTSAVFMSTGQPATVSRVNLVQLAVVIPLVYPVARQYGVTAVAALFTAAYAIGSVYALRKVQQVLGIGVRGYISAIALPLAASGAAGATAWVISQGLRSDIVTVAGTSLVMLAAYSTLVWLFDRSSFRGVLTLLARSGQAGETS